MMVKDKPRCFICRRGIGLTKTDCCKKHICDFGEPGRRRPCFEKHDRFTLCGSHYHEEHKGRWQDCKECLAAFQMEMYVWYGTNEYNHEKLTNPPAFEPTLCSTCGEIIKLPEGGYSNCGPKYTCRSCRIKEMDVQAKPRIVG